MTDLLTIAQVSLETGIAKEVLRKWETRYGFPTPARDERGQRGYTQAQLVRLRLIKKLLDDGCRPAQVVPMPAAALQSLLAEQTAPGWIETSRETPSVVAWLQQRDPALLRSELSGELKARGLLGFARDLMPDMNTQVGQAWENGKIATRDEHIYSETVQGLVWEVLGEYIMPSATPRVLLATPSGEEHVLGLLMLEAVLTLEKAYCISMGPQSPLPEIVSAAKEFDADIVALSISLAFPKKKVLPLLKALRAELPPEVKLWAGGGGTLGIDPKPRGISLLASLPEAVEQLKKFRNQ